MFCLSVKMVTSCAAYGCYNRAKKGSRVKFHKFPSIKRADLRKRWIHAMKRKGFQPSDSTKVCSDHFRSDDFKTGLKNKTLKRGAIPIVNVMNKSMVKEEPVQKVPRRVQGRTTKGPDTKRLERCQRREKECESLMSYNDSALMENKIYNSVCQKEREFNLRIPGSTSFSGNTSFSDKNIPRELHYERSNDENDSVNNDEDPLATDRAKSESKRITSAEAKAAIETLRQFLLLSDLNIEEMLLHSKYEELIMSKIK